MPSLIDKLIEYRSAKFASFIYTTKETGEVARYVLILNADTESLYRKDIETITAMLPTLTTLIDRQAAKSILQSLEESLTVGIGNNSRYTNAETYWMVPEIKNMKVHRDTGELYISGLLMRKDVIQEGAPRKPVNSAPLTIAKRRINKNLRRGQYRFFSIPNVKEVRMDGEVLEVISE